LKNNFLDTFALFLKQLNVPVTETSALEFLETHPDEGTMRPIQMLLIILILKMPLLKINHKDLVFSRGKIQ
jgi:hypothetical protein